LATTSSSLAREVPGFTDSLSAENKAPRTIQSYRESVEQFLTWLASQEAPPARWRDVTRQHVQGFINHVLSRHKATTAAVRYRSLQQFFKYLEVEELIDVSPMAKMKPPQVPEEHRRTLGDDEVRALFKTCAGKTFEDRRDTAILSLFYDTGVRLEEMAGIQLDEVDLDAKTVLVHGKGGRDRVVGFEPETARDLRRYLRVRDEHRAYESPALWLGKRGVFGVSGVTIMLRRRVREAGLELRITPHLFRHTAIDRMLGSGMSEGDVMRQVGHKTDTMIRKVYAQQTANQRALEARRKVRLRGRFN
jgi:site-specific recombinase XerD